MNKSTENILTYTKVTSVYEPNSFRVYKHKHKNGKIYHSKCVLSVQPIQFRKPEVTIVNNPKYVKAFSVLRKRLDRFIFRRITEEELQEIKLGLL